MSEAGERSYASPVSCGTPLLRVGSTEPTGLPFIIVAMAADQRAKSTFSCSAVVPSTMSRDMKTRCRCGGVAMPTWWSPV